MSNQIRTLLILLVLALVAVASATIKDPRQHVKLNPELSQDAVARQQALQHGQREVGQVPERTDDSGYMPQSQEDAAAASVVARHDPQAPNAAADTLAKNAAYQGDEAAKPKKAAFGALWALFIGLVIAFGVWAGMQKFASTPPDVR